MKLSIITVTLNSKKTIISTLNSILSQTYKNIEHIIVDGGSIDGTIKIIQEYNHKNKKVIIKKGMGIYESMNAGIKESTGDIISILNSDDIYQNENTISDVMNLIMKNPEYPIYLGDVVYFKDTSFFDIYRHYKAKNFKKWHLKIGLMPPHPPSFMKKNVYEKYGMYYEKFKIASDFEIFLRLIYQNNLKFFKLNKVIVRMRIGGISGRNLQSYIISSIEIIKSFEINNIKTNLFNILLRLPPKILQYLIFKKKNLNSDFRLFKIKFGEHYLEKSFKIIKHSKSIPYDKNFILSGLNLAFLGYYFKEEIPYHNKIIHWPDGLFAKTIFDSINKIPGRLIIQNMKLPDDINKIVVLGNLTTHNKNFLIEKFKKPIEHLELPYGNFEYIKKYINLRIDKNTIIFLTLPTPKQEQIAIELAKKSEYYKIICIGASISIASGQEKAVPKRLENFEFLWRLRTDPLRRTLRLLESMFYFAKGKYIQKKLKYLNIYTIE